MTADDLLERLQAAVAARQLEKGEVPNDDDAGALAALHARQADAGAALGEVLDWISAGSDLLGRLWECVDACEDSGLLLLLGDLTGRETGLQGALSDLVRHVEATLGERHGRGAIMLNGVVAAAVDRSAASTKWDVDAAWPRVGWAVRNADRLAIGGGEVEDDTARALRIVRQLCGISYLRMGACQELGIDPDDYRTQSNWRWVVKLP